MSVAVFAAGGPPRKVICTGIVEYRSCHFSLALVLDRSRVNIHGAQVLFSRRIEKSIAVGPRSVFTIAFLFAVSTRFSN